MNFCEHGNESSGFMNTKDFFALTEPQLLLDDDSGQFSLYGAIVIAL
jgi:hypothetical protein